MWGIAERAVSTTPFNSKTKSSLFVVTYYTDPAQTFSKVVLEKCSEKIFRKNALRKLDFSSCISKVAT